MTNNTEPNAKSNIVEQDNNPEHLKPDSLKVEKDLGKVALYRVMNLDYHPDAKKMMRPVSMNIL